MITVIMVWWSQVPQPTCYLLHGSWGTWQGVVWKGLSCGQWSFKGVIAIKCDLTPQWPGLSHFSIFQVLDLSAGVEMLVGPGDRVEKGQVKILSCFVPNMGNPGSFCISQPLNHHHHDQWSCWSPHSSSRPNSMILPRCGPKCTTTGQFRTTSCRQRSKLLTWPLTKLSPFQGFHLYSWRPEEQ